MYDPIAFFNDNAYNSNFCLFRSVHEEKIEDIKGVIWKRISQERQIQWPTENGQKRQKNMYKTLHKN